ncbi:MAG: hypothetical protein JWN23_1133 [Rhodocyclales bacterium]|nr:hypothetical protein [Rhodocyclales bacterium]
MTTLTQLVTRRYLPDGSPKPHYVATFGGRLSWPAEATHLMRVFRFGVGGSSYSLAEIRACPKIAWGSDILAIRWMKES